MDLCQIPDDLFLEFIGFKTLRPTPPAYTTRISLFRPLIRKPSFTNFSTVEQHQFPIKSI